MAKQYNFEESVPFRIEMRRLLGRQLDVPLVVVVEPVSPGFVARAAGISVFGYGHDAVEAIEVLKEGMENIYKGEEFPDLQAAIRRMFVPKDIMEDPNREE